MPGWAESSFKRLPIVADDAVARDSVDRSFRLTASAKATASLAEALRAKTEAGSYEVGSLKAEATMERV